MFGSAHFRMDCEFYMPKADRFRLYHRRLPSEGWFLKYITLYPGTWHPAGFVRIFYA